MTATSDNNSGVKMASSSYLKLSVTWIALSIAALLFAAGVVGKINFSSLGAWNAYQTKFESVPGLLTGQARGIRSDEWLLGVPWILSQSNTTPPFATENPSVGPSTSALFVGLPTRHWSLLFRPAHWGFFLFDVERGFSWLWMTRTVVCFLALFLLLYELTSYSILLATLGAVWIFFSAFVQWWFSSVAELILYFAGACLAVRYVLVMPTAIQIAAGSLMLFICGGAFALTVYPPFQIPLAYLGLALLPLLAARGEPSKGPNRRYRGVCLMAALIGAGTAMYFFAVANQDVIRMMRDTVYPGQRMSVGGGLSVSRYFSGIFSAGFSEAVFPVEWGNICEASSFLVLWPVSALMLAFSSSKRLFFTLLPLLVYLLCTAAWALWGTNSMIAFGTLWSMVPVTRGVIGWGIGGAIFVVVVMSRLPKPSRTKGAWATVFALIAVATLLHESRHSALSMVSQFNLLSAALTGAACCLAIIWRWPRALAACVGIVTVYPHAGVNPTMSGMRIIQSAKLVRAVKRFDAEKKGRWVVFGSTIETQLVKATGRKVLNGYQYLPPFSLIKGLDPSGQQTSIYNRYAHIVFAEGDRGVAPNFRLLTTDSWQVTVDPCDAGLKAAGVTYVLFAQQPRRTRLDCFERIYLEDAFSIYKRR